MPHLSQALPHATTPRDINRQYYRNPRLDEMLLVDRAPPPTEFRRSNRPSNRSQGARKARQQRASQPSTIPAHQQINDFSTIGLIPMDYSCQFARHGTLSSLQDQSSGTHMGAP